MGDTSSIVIRRAGAEDTDLMAEILAEAFAGDPVGVWMTPAPGWGRWFWSRILPMVLPRGEAYVTSCGQGVALWVPPGAKLDIRPPLAVVWEAWRRFRTRPLVRLFRMMRAVEKLQPKERHYHLFAIGVRSGAKGQGIGSALLAPVLRTCDRDKVLSYLESSNARNLSFYQRHGFKLMHRIALPSQGPSLYLMHRTPIAPG